MAPTAVTLGRRFFEDLLSTGNWDIGGEILSPDVVMHHPASPDPIAPYAAVQGALVAFRTAFPDLHITVLDAFGSDERAVVRWQMTGTNTGLMYGAPATNKAVKVNGMSIVRVENGKIVEDWVSEDTIGMLRQLGMA